MPPSIAEEPMLQAKPLSPVREHEALQRDQHLISLGTDSHKLLSFDLFNLLWPPLASQGLIGAKY
jgi:hypothetical protein